MQTELVFLEQEIPIWEVARALGWTAQKTRRTFISAGLARRLPGTGWHVMRSDLRRWAPSIEQRVQELRALGELSMRGRARYGNGNARRSKRSKRPTLPHIGVGGRDDEVGRC